MGKFPTSPRFSTVAWVSRVFFGAGVPPPTTMEVATVCQKNLEFRMDEELRRAALLKQMPLPGHLKMVHRALDRAMRLEAYVAVNR